MKAAGLKAIDTVLESTAILIKSKKTKNEMVNLITSRISGVISKFSSFLNHISGINHLPSRPKIRLMPIQHPTESPLVRRTDHTRKASTNYHRSRGGGLGGRELDGGEEGYRQRDGRPGGGRCNGYSSPEYLQFENEIGKQYQRSTISAPAYIRKPTP